MSERLTDAACEAWVKQFRRERFREAVANRCLVQSLKSLCFAIGGTHVAGWVEEAERAAREGRTVKYE
jgi:hypothetical protein